MLTHDHGAVLAWDPSTIDALVRAGKADPELLRSLGLRNAERFSAARFQPPAGAPAQVAAAPYNAGNVFHPLAAPTISGTTFQIDLALANPTRVLTPIVMDLTATRFFVDRAFTSAGGVSGGAVVYDEIAMDLYADRDVQRVAPGDEFPLITFSRRAPKVAEPEKWGGKFFFTDEARDRNDTTAFRNAMRQLGNTIVRKLNQRGVEILEALITANSRTVTGNNWRNVVTAGGAPSNFTAYPARDFAKADLIAEQEEIGVNYNLWIMNPEQMFDLEGIYGDRLAALLASFGISIYVTNRVAAGTAYALAEGQVGEMRIESPLATETWRDPNGKQQTWVQSSVRPLMYANNPYAVLKFTGLQ